ncbi:hypothetical protein GCM10028862_11520 [Luteimonas pelagia]
MTTPLPHRPQGRFALPLLALGVAGFAAGWIALGALTGRMCGWMAVLAALDAALLLRLGGMAPGWRRAAWGTGATVLMILLANWGIVATQVGVPLGLDPITSAAKLGPSLAWLMARLGNSALDAGWLLAGVAIAAIASR